jgi:mannonate dehydratase
MQRRDFLATTASVALAPAQTASKPKIMRLGHQNHDDDESLAIFSCFGLKNICSRLPSKTLDENWSVDGLKRLRERINKHGVELDMVPIPMSSSPIEKAEMPAIMLGQNPQRDKDIDAICQMIRNCAAAGIPSVKYNFTFLGVPRTEATKGRGTSTYSTWVYSKAKHEPPLTIAGKINEDVYWERITYFLERVVPVATENKVRLACHPQDPGMPKGKGYKGVETVLGSVAGLKKFVSIKESPYHGLNFCQGTVSEMLEDPKREIFDVIRYFGTRKKIFNVHFRNIEGKFSDFRETFPDNGDIDMLQAIKVYKEVGYDGMLMPDHVPRIPGDTGGRLGYTFAFGYIQAALQSVGMHA